MACPFSKTSSVPYSHIEGPGLPGYTSKLRRYSQTCISLFLPGLLFLRPCHDFLGGGGQYIIRAKSRPKTFCLFPSPSLLVKDGHRPQTALSSTRGPASQACGFSTHCQNSSVLLTTECAFAAHILPVLTRSNQSSIVVPLFPFAVLPILSAELPPALGLHSV